MRDRPIAVGDLVQVVRPTPCCGNETALGITYRVVSKNSAWRYACIYCGASLEGDVADKMLGFGALVSRLKRIPPLDELEGERTDETLKEPANAR